MRPAVGAPERISSGIVLLGGLAFGVMQIAKLPRQHLLREVYEAELKLPDIRQVHHRQNAEPGEHPEQEHPEGQGRSGMRRWVDEIRSDEEDDADHGHHCHAEIPTTATTLVDVGEIEPRPRHI